MRDHCWVAAAAIAVLVPVACATTAADFRLDSLRPDEAAIVGKVDVIYNGRLSTDNCGIELAGAHYKLDPSGLVFLKVKRGTHSLMTLACHDISLYHYQFRDARLVAEGGGVITYFGNATVTWQTDGGLKVSSMFGVIGAIADSSSNDGRAVMVVADEPEFVRRAFVKQVGPTQPWVTRLLAPGR
jgi:hypothetical protein